MNEDRASRYQRLRRRAALGGAALTGIGLLILVLSGGAVALRTAAVTFAGGQTLSAVLLFVLILALAQETVLLPLAYYSGVTLERRYGLSTESTGHWWLDHFKAAVLGLAATIAAGSAVWLFLRLTPDWWWMLTAVLFTVVLVALTQLAPVLLLPLFDPTRPLDRDELVARLMALASRANTSVLGVFEWRLSGRTRKANAALTGIGRTRRILVSDTLLADHSDDEIEVILAHEIAHHVYHDIWTAIGLEAVVITAAAWVADAALSRSVPVLALSGKADIAGLPVIALAFGLVSILGRPLHNALSRAHERRADRYALEITGNAAAFVSAMKRLGEQNLSDDSPSPLVERVFYTHPPVSARIAAARAWAASRVR